MRILRRSSAATVQPSAGTTAVEPSENGELAGPGKGRPTPKRRDQQKKRRTPLTAPTSRKEAVRQTRERDKAARLEARQALRSGDERHLPKTHAGPARRLARDLIDSHRTIGSYSVPVLLIYAVSILLPYVRYYMPPIAILYFVIAGIQAFALGKRAKRLVEERLPHESSQGIVLYAAMRALSWRRLRLPPPKVRVGDAV